MEKPFDSQLARMPRSQLTILKYLLSRSENIVTTGEIARRTGIVEKQLGGVLSAMSRRRVQATSLIEPMGRDLTAGLRWRLNPKAITTSLALGRVKALLSRY